ncbi:MAG TPA: hypothetical protein VK303_02605 [Desulfobacteria bacterium]|nr:hypothetical protein [Desulfobacteria bacterium]
MGRPRKEGRKTKCHKDRNLGPARKRYRARFFGAPLGRKAKKIARFLATGKAGNWRTYPADHRWI